MSYPYIPADGSHTGGAQAGCSRIVVHATVSATKRGGARQVAAYFQSASAGGAAHYVLDPTELIQCIHEDVVGYHAPPNQDSIGIELCDPQIGPPDRWADPDHEAMLHLAAKLVVEIAHRNGIPLVQLSVADLKAGKHGICGHVDVSHAFGQSSHTDPGVGFPWDHFMQLVQAASGTASQEDIVTPADQKAIAAEVVKELRPELLRLAQYLAGKENGAYNHQPNSVGVPAPSLK